MALRFFLPVAGGEKDLSGKVVIVTGGNSGIGLETVKELAKRKAKVIMAVRNVEKAQPIAEGINTSTGNDNVVIMMLDLASFNSVQEFAKKFSEAEHRLDILINNAGVVIKDFTKTVDGHETTFQTNCLGPFLLTMLLKDLLIKSQPSRIITVASSAHTIGEIRFDDLDREKDFGSFAAYAQSKLANILFTLQLEKELRGTGVTAYSLHPGFVRTPILGNQDFKMRFLGAVQGLFAMDANKGAQTSIYCATEPGIEKHSGTYFVSCDVVGSWRIMSKAKDEEVAQRLWEICLERTKEYLPV